MAAHQPAPRHRPEAPFIYEPVAVPSLEDALIGILLNYNVQAVVVRPGLTLKSRNNMEILNKYLHRASDEEEVDGLAPDEYGPETCRLRASTTASVRGPGASSPMMIL